MNFRRSAAKSLGNKIQLACQLRDAPVVIAAPPSDATDYPRVAVWLERHRVIWSQDDELMVDADGEILAGGRAQLGLDEIVGPARVGIERRLSRVGTISSSGRIWVGCRLSPLREQVESQILEVFAQEEIGIGTTLLEIPQPVVSGEVIPWSWTAAATIDNTEWSDEFAFSERLWSWISFDLDVEILVARSTPENKRLIVALNAYFAQPDEDPQFINQINLDGSVTTFTP